MASGKHTAPKGVEHLKAALAGKTSVYAGGWGEGNITDGHSSKNIPLLFAAGDALIAYRRHNKSKLHTITLAVQGYLATSKKHGSFHAEEFSTIYTRWIFMSLLILWNITLIEDLRLFIRSVVSLAVLSSSPQPKFTRSNYSKNKHKMVLATPYTLFGGPRSWVRGKGEDNRRTDEDSIVWHDADSMCELIDHMVGTHVMGKSGNNFLYDTIIRVKKLWGNHWNPLTDLEQDTLSDVTLEDNNMASVKRVFEFIDAFPVGPARGEIHIYRDIHGNVVTLYTAAYKYGSTSFMQFKEFDVNTDKFYTVGVADPKKRTNGEMSTANIIEKNGYLYANVTAKDGTIFDMDLLKDVSPGTIQTRLAVKADWLYHGTFTTRSVGREFIDDGASVPDEPDEPDKPGEPDMPDDKSSRDQLIDLLLDHFIKYITESGLLEEIMAKLIAKMLKR